MIEDVVSGLDSQSDCPAFAEENPNKTKKINKEFGGQR